MPTVFELNQLPGKSHGVQESMKSSLAAEGGHGVRSIAHEYDAARGEAFQFEVAPNVVAVSHAADGGQFEDFAEAGGQLGGGGHGVVVFVLQAGGLEPVVGVGDIGVGPHHHPEEAP